MFLLLDLHQNFRGDLVRLMAVFPPLQFLAFCLYLIKALFQPDRFEFKTFRFQELLLNKHRKLSRFILAIENDLDFVDDVL